MEVQNPTSNLPLWSEGQALPLNVSMYQCILSSSLVLDAISLYCWVHPAYCLLLCYRYLIWDATLCPGSWCLYAFPLLLKNFLIAILVLMSHLLILVAFGE